MDSIETKANGQHIILTQQQPGLTPFHIPLLEYQPPVNPNQYLVQHEPGYLSPTAPPPEYHNVVHPNPSAHVQQISGYQPGVMVDQPMIQHHPQRMVVERPVPVPDYMCLSIFTTLCCCLCLGIGAIVDSRQANAMRHSNPREARLRAKKALMMNVIGIVLGVVIGTIFGILHVSKMI